MVSWVGGGEWFTVPDLGFAILPALNHTAEEYRVISKMNEGGASWGREEPADMTQWQPRDQSARDLATNCQW
jgi:hypothetical protein